MGFYGLCVGSARLILRTSLESSRSGRVPRNGVAMILYLILRSAWQQVDIYRGRLN